MKSDLAQELLRAHQDLAAVVATISEQSRGKRIIDFTGGKVRAADVVAYQIGWGRLLISWYEAGLLGEVPKMPGEGFTKWNYSALALHFYEKYHYDGFNRQDEAFSAVVQRIIKIVEIEAQTGNLEKLGVWQWCTLPSKKQWPLAKWVRVNTVAPYKRATVLLRAFVHSKALEK